MLTASQKLLIDYRANTNRISIKSHVSHLSSQK